MQQNLETNLTSPLSAALEDVDCDLRLPFAVTSLSSRTTNVYDQMETGATDLRFPTFWSTVTPVSVGCRHGLQMGRNVTICLLKQGKEICFVDQDSGRSEMLVLFLGPTMRRRSTLDLDKAIS